MISIVIFVTLLTTAFCSWTPSKCPQPCSCSLKFSEWFQTELRTVDCSNEGLTEFPTNLPENVQVLILSDNRLVQLFHTNNDQPIFLHDLLHLDLSRNRIDSLGTDSRLREVYNLRILDLSHNRLTSLSDYTFAGLFNLERLNLAQNIIGNNVGDRAFHGLLKLQVLELTGNQLEYVQPGWWSGSRLDNLHELRLDGNHLSFLQPDVFDNLQTLRRLDLGRNKLVRIHPDAWRGVQNLQILNLDYNRLRQVPVEALAKLRRHLQSINLNHNPIDRLKTGDFAGFPRLKDISCNYMPNLHFLEQASFRNLPELIILEVHDNPQLSYVDDRALVDTGDLSHLFLHNNNLTGIGETLVQNLERLEQLTIYGNPLACDCTTRWLKTIIETTSELDELLTKNTSRPALVIRDVDRMICNSPQEHKFKLFAQLDLDDISEQCQARIVLLHQSATSSEPFSGRKIRLDCKATGLPRPKLFWLSPDGTIVNELLGEHPENDKFVLEHHGESLVITGFGKPDAGLYTCVADNGRGSRAMASVNLQPILAPIHLGNLDIHVGQIGATGAQISWPTDLGHNQHGEVQPGRLRLTYASVNSNQDDQTTLKHADQVFMRRSFVKLPYATNKHALKHLQPDTQYEVCLALQDDQDVLVRLQCVKFRTLPSKNIEDPSFPTSSTSLDSEKLGNLAVGITLAVMVLVLVVLTLVVLVLKNRNATSRFDQRAAFAAMLQADNLMYVATPVDCKHFVFGDDATATPNLYQEFDRKSVYSAFHEPRSRLVMV